MVSSFSVRDARNWAATALSAWRVKISASATFGTELGTGAYPATITADTVIWQATFRKLL